MRNFIKKCMGDYLYTIFLVISTALIVFAVTLIIGALTKSPMATTVAFCLVLAGVILTYLWALVE